MRHIRITKSYQATYTDPLKVRPGDELSVLRRDEEWPGWIWCTNSAGKGAWVPEAYVQMHGTTCTVKHDYDSTELSVNVGDMLTVAAEESGWLWCVNTGGQHGWIPANHAETLPQ